MWQFRQMSGITTNTPAQLYPKFFLILKSSNEITEIIRKFCQPLQEKAIAAEKGDQEQFGRDVVVAATAAAAATAFWQTGCNNQLICNK